MQDSFAYIGEALLELMHFYFGFQGQTMQMMYGIIAKELKSSGLENSDPTDYLNFYCLGNREEWHEESNSAAKVSSSGEVVTIMHLTLDKPCTLQTLGFPYYVRCTKEEFLVYDLFFFFPIKILSCSVSCRKT